LELEQRQYGETIDHLLIKRFFYENIPLVNEVKTIVQEIKIADRIADVYLELKNGKRVVMEIQHSKITKEELLQRTKEYSQEGIHVLWILDGKGPYDKSPRTMNGVNISVSEKELHSLYRGRVYYMNATRDGILSPVYALHYAPYIKKMTSKYGFPFYKRLKLKKSVIYSEPPSLQLTLFRNRMYRLARFMDENVKELCIEEVVQFINTYLAYREMKPKEAKKLFPNGLLLEVFIHKFSEKYGLYLLFEVLRYLKFLTIRDAKYMFENNLQSQKSIF